MAKKSHKKYGRLPSECGTSGCRMDEHQGKINHQHTGQSVFGKCQVSTAIECVGGKCADQKFDCEKRKWPMTEDASHQTVAFRSNIQIYPEECQLSIEPVHYK